MWWWENLRRISDWANHSAWRSGVLAINRSTTNLDATDWAHRFFDIGGTHTAWLQDHNGLLEFVRYRDTMESTLTDQWRFGHGKWPKLLQTEPALTDFLEKPQLVGWLHIRWEEQI